ncbi:hypothetical protein ACFQ4C_12405 [Larkinella insperata]|uniref:Uncharacterized protein n=1 Tax=Larkinella insperata TaxID=332158 RepID=A0ABW3QM85_9BACT|nr:hypothetical protein [Larkinella insperata]
MPYAKIQGIPLAATLALFAFIELYKRSLLRPMLTCVAAGLLGTVFVGIDLYCTNLFTDFYYAYTRFNLGYSSLFRELRWDIPVRLLLEADKRSDVFNLFFFLGFTLFAVFGLGIRLLRVRRWNRPVLYALILLVVAWFSIIRSGQSFHHYLFLFSAPLFWGLGIVIGETASGTASRPWAVTVVFLYTVFFGLALFSRNKGIECAHAFQKPADPLVSAIQSLARPSDRVSIWGHGDLARLHCYTGLLPGTRDVFASRQINPSGLQPYFLDVTGAIYTRIRPGFWLKIPAMNRISYGSTRWMRRCWWAINCIRCITRPSSTSEKTTGKIVRPSCQKNR